MIFDRKLLQICKNICAMHTNCFSFVRWADWRIQWFSCFKILFLCLKNKHRDASDEFLFLNQKNRPHRKGKSEYILRAVVLASHFNDSVNSICILMSSSDCKTILMNNAKINILETLFKIHQFSFLHRVSSKQTWEMHVNCVTAYQGQRCCWASLRLNLLRDLWRRMALILILTSKPQISRKMCEIMWNIWTSRSSLFAAF